MVAEISTQVFWKSSQGSEPQSPCPALVHVLITPDILKLKGLASRRGWICVQHGLWRWPQRCIVIVNSGHCIDYICTQLLFYVCYTLIKYFLFLIRARDGILYLVQVLDKYASFKPYIQPVKWAFKSTVKDSESI